ncbi:MAG: SDR family oxidoreductase [Chloroflexi bacterium]|nr:SDR family oxidoreductase [Chloroflexota bacterium]
MQRFEGRIALVTGAAGGIGQAVCRRLASEGAAIVATDLQASQVEGLASELRGNDGGRALALGLDVRDKSSAVQAVNAAIKEFGKLDVLINNAGIFAQTPLLEIQAERWDALMAINLRGVLLCSQAAVEAMISDGRGGAIVNLASLAGQVGGVVAGADYAASKAGVVALTKSLAKVAAPYGIRVNAVNPGVIDTAMPAQFPPAARARMIEDTPLKRMGRPDEVAAAIAFLASDDASFITGTTLDINGGLYV